MKRTLIILAFVFTLSQHVPAQIFDPSVQFSLTNNPNGVWQYGFEPTTLGSGFTLYDATGSLVTNVIDVWHRSTPFEPSIVHNRTGGSVTNSERIVWEADALSLHPGQLGQFSVLRFVAPSDSIYNLSVSFQGIDQDGASTDVHVLTNGVSLFDQLVTGYHQPVSLTTVLTLVQNETVDFAVGYGANRRYEHDSTGINASLMVIPEPGSGILVLLGISSLFAATIVYRWKSKIMQR